LWFSRRLTISSLVLDLRNRSRSRNRQPKLSQNLFVETYLRL
jgi:hypothetical protein